MSDVVSSAAATPARDGDWHTEARVQEMLIKYLDREGWEIVRSADTARRERGVDIEATRGIETVAIEVKGFPGRNYADPRRAGERKRTQPSTQAKGWYGRAILAAMIVRTQKPAVRAVIAFPDFPRYRELYRQTAGQLQKCDIELWWITREGNVTVAAAQPELDQPRHCRYRRSQHTLGADTHTDEAAAARPVIGVRLPFRLQQDLSNEANVAGHGTSHVTEPLVVDVQPIQLIPGLAPVLIPWTVARFLFQCRGPRAPLSLPPRSLLPRSDRPGMVRRP